MSASKRKRTRCSVRRATPPNQVRVVSDVRDLCQALDDAYNSQLPGWDPVTRTVKRDKR